MECGIDGFFFFFLCGHQHSATEQESNSLNHLLSYEYSDNDNQLKNGGIHNETEKWANNMKCEKEEEIWFVVTTLQQPANHSICLWLHHYYIYIYIHAQWKLAQKSNTHNYEAQREKRNLSHCIIRVPMQCDNAKVKCVTQLHFSAVYGWAFTFIVNYDFCFLWLILIKFK